MCQYATSLSILRAGALKSLTRKCNSEVGWAMPARANPDARQILPITSSLAKRHGSLLGHALCPARYPNVVSSAPIGRRTRDIISSVTEFPLQQACRSKPIRKDAIASDMPFQLLSSFSKNLLLHCLCLPLLHSIGRPRSLRWRRVRFLNLKVLASLRVLD